MSNVIDPIMSLWPPTQKQTVVSITIPAAGKVGTGTAVGLAAITQTIGVWLTGNGTTVANGLIANPYLGPANTVGVSLALNTSGMVVNALVQGY